MYNSVPTTLMRVLTDREGLQPLASEPAWRERWQWWTDRPCVPADAAEGRRRRWGLASRRTRAAAPECDQRTVKGCEALAEAGA